AVLAGSFRTWWQMKKTISFANIALRENLALIVSLAPVEGGPACAESLNKYLSGPSSRPQKPKQNITDEEVRGKLGIVGLNYDPGVTFDLATTFVGSDIKTGFRVCTVKDGKVGSFNEIATSLTAESNKKSIYTADPIDTGASRSGLWDVNGVVDVKFRLEAFYNFTIGTSGLDYTPFEIYVRGRLANAHLEAM